MAFNYNVDFSKVWQDNMPPNKRLTKYLAWGKLLVYPLQWVHSRFFIDYKDGSVAPDWNILTVYTKDSLVRYTNKSIYSCIKNTTAGITPLNTEYWYKTQDNFIGLTERVQYTSQLIVFEYALSRWFGLTFVQPPSVNTIFILNNNIDVNSFLVSSDDTNSAFVSNEGAEALQFVGQDYTLANTVIYSFTICYPTTLPATLGITDAILKQQIASLADKLKISGTKYNIISY
jgi:hypothetical protein